MLVNAMKPKNHEYLQGILLGAFCFDAALKCAEQGISLSLCKPLHRRRMLLLF
jgi:hypothetical protein